MRELERESAQNDSGAAGRVRWLSNQLEQYLERWLGFCAISDAPMSSLVDSVAFGAVEIAADVLTPELRNAEVPVTVDDAWQAFLTSLRRVRDEADRQQAQGLRAPFAAFRETLLAAT